MMMHQRFKSQQEESSQQQPLHSNLHYDQSHQHHRAKSSEADVAAGNVATMPPPGSGGSTSIDVSQFLYYSPKADVNGYDSAPRSAAASLVSIKEPTNLEFFDDLVSEPVLVLGVDISHLDRNSQFMVCAAGVFGFSLLYGYLQELISVELCGRQLGLFLAMFQFTGYTILAFFLRNFVYAKQQRHRKRQMAARSSTSSLSKLNYEDESKRLVPDGSSTDGISSTAALSVPLVLYVGLSILRAIDLGMTNLAMQYINYPAKTLMKSSRVVFTMLFGVVISRKKYKPVDYVIVLSMVAGLALFMHADANSSAVFDLSGVLMLTVSLLCDGAISNVSETIMSKFGVGQDEFIFRMYSIALGAITLAAAFKGDLTEGFSWLLQSGTYDELKLPVEERTWTVPGKIAVMVLFSSMGFFGSSCSAAITKNFGALTMSIVSTTRKATTLFLSFFLFNNVCTMEHLLGVFIFIAALLAKSLRRKSDKKPPKKSRRSRGRTGAAKKGYTRSNTNDSLFKSDSSVSDVSDVEVALAGTGGRNREKAIPTIVHADKTTNLRSRQSHLSTSLSRSPSSSNGYGGEQQGASGAGQFISTL